MMGSHTGKKKKELIVPFRFFTSGHKKGEEGEKSNIHEGPKVLLLVLVNLRKSLFQLGKYFYFTVPP